MANRTWFYFVGLMAIVVLLVIAVGVRSSRHAATCADQSPALPLQLVSDVDVNPSSAPRHGKLPRMDYETIDPDRRMLYVAYPGANEILVFDLNRNEVVGHIQSLRSVHGVSAISAFHRLYAAVSGGDQLATIDERSQKIVARASVGAYPDGIAYDPRNRKLFVSNAHATSDSVVDTTTGRVASIALGGEPGNVQYDAATGQVFSVVGSRNELVAIDPRKNHIVARYPLPGCDHDHALLIDAPRRLAFVACERNARLVVLDMTTLKEQSTYQVGADPDIMAFDAGLGRLYVAAESGDVAVFQVQGRSLQPLGLGCLAYEAHTVAVDPQTHRVYFGLQNVDGRPIIRVMEPTRLDQSVH